MVQSPGEVSRIEAAAQQARAWFRDLAVMAFGLIRDRSLVTGRLVPTTPMLRRLRLHRYEDDLERHTHFAEKDIFGHAWQSVDQIAFAGVMWTQGEYDTLLERMGALRQQTAAIVDLHEGNLFDRLMCSDVSIEALGRMKSPFKDLAMPHFAALESD